MASLASRRGGPQNYQVLVDRLGCTREDALKLLENADGDIAAAENAYLETALVDDLAEAQRLQLELRGLETVAIDLQKKHDEYQQNQLRYQKLQNAIGVYEVSAFPSIGCPLQVDRGARSKAPMVCNNLPSFLMSLQLLRASAYASFPRFPAWLYCRRASCCCTGTSRPLRERMPRSRPKWPRRRGPQRPRRLRSSKKKGELDQSAADSAMHGRHCMGLKSAPGLIHRMQLAAISSIQPCGQDFAMETAVSWRARGRRWRACSSRASSCWRSW